MNSVGMNNGCVEWSASHMLLTFLDIVKLQCSLAVQSKSVGLGVDMKMTVQTPFTPPPHLATQTQHELHKPHNNIHR